MPDATPPDLGHDSTLRGEFARASATFGDRTRSRFDDLGVVGFSGVSHGARVAELGAGTANFLRLFRDVASVLVAVDLTPEMLERARQHYPEVHAVVGDARRAPLAARSFDLVASAQALHHIHDPLKVLKEMRRLTAPAGRVLIVDQVGPEKVEELVVMNELELTRDPSHAATRPVSGFRMMTRAAGLEPVAERVVEQRQSFAQWMWPEEFPPDRIARVLDFIERHGAETGMQWERDGGEWWFTRRRIMLLAERPGA